MCEWNCAKKVINESPFVKYFEYGQSHEGYWDYNHMILQLEDCIDCLKTLYPQFDFIFMFDHSSGHTKKRRGGLDASGMNKWFGGAQPTMRRTYTPTVDGYLGPFHDPSNQNMIQPGQWQEMSFEVGAIGLCWMSENERNN